MPNKISDYQMEVNIIHLLLDVSESSIIALAGILAGRL